MGKRPRYTGRILVGLALAVGALAVACGGGASKKDLDAAQTALKAKDAEVTQIKADLAKAQADLGPLKDQLAKAVPAQVVQAGQLQPAPAGQQPSGWDTADSIRGGLKLLATYDSSGPDAWSAKDHPTVYFTSEGGNNNYAGLQIIDASTKKVIASAQFQLGEYKVSPHTVGVSPDGKWAYLQGGRTVDVGGKPTNEDVTLVINARTLKIDKILKQESMFQGTLRVQRLHHVMGFVDSKGQDRVVLEYGFGSNGGPHFLIDPKNNNRVVMAITTEDTGYWMGHPFLTVDPTGKYLYVGLKMAAWAGSVEGVGGLAKINLENRAVTIIPDVGNHLIGMAHTADGKFTYVNDAEGSMVYKIDNATNTVVGKASAVVVGPYGMCMNWDETKLYTVGKGEGSANNGTVLGVVDLKTFTPMRGLPANPIYLGGTGKVSSIDHCFLHPDPAVNEIWVSNMSGDETIVVDLATDKVKAYIPSPNGGNTHSGAFVQYSADWTGKVLADHGGPQRDLYAARLATIAAATKK